jgi:hypothetical protein
VKRIHLIGEFVFQPYSKVLIGEPDVLCRLLSEKLDGVRAFWNGKHLFSRMGRIIPAPESITSSLPPVSLDGELWYSAIAYHCVVIKLSFHIGKEEEHFLR